MTQSIVIVGAGQAGVQAVASLRSEGFTGAITLIGDEPFPPYQRPPLSKAYLAGEMVRERLFLKPDSFYAEADCNLRLNLRVTAIDRQTKSVRLSDGSSLPYDKLLLTTGARVRRIDAPGSDLNFVRYLRGIEDVDLLRPHLKEGQRLAVVGGGYIGLEVAAVAVKHGLKVTVIEAARRVMERAVSPFLSSFYESEHKRQGVEIVLGAGAEGFEGRTRVEAVRTSVGTFPADFALVGIGVVPNSEIAAEAGLVVDNGIVVDAFTATEDPDIYAAGDCTNHPAFAGGRSRLESVQNAIDQAKYAALALLGKPKPYREVPWFWSDQYDLKMQIAGLLKPGDGAVVRGDPAVRKFAVFHLRDGKLAAVEAVNAAVEYMVGRKLIASGAAVDSARLADLSVPMKSFA
jgi:3-phenylpropionate/trans-cinnamate dioxygenase ferredoxin reductase subunit